MPRNNRKRNNNNNSNASLQIGRPSVPSEVLVRMRLGYAFSLPFTGGTSTLTRMNDPTSLIAGWGLRATDFLTYRIVALKCHLTPKDAVSGGTPQNQNKTYASVLQESVTAPAAPTSATAIMEYPNARLLPYNSANSKSMTTYGWRCRDLNGLLYGPVASPPPGTGVYLFSQLGSAPTGTAGADVNGYMDVEFRGLTTI